MIAPARLDDVRATIERTEVPCVSAYLPAQHIRAAEDSIVVPRERRAADEDLPDMVAILRHREAV